MTKRILHFFFFLIFIGHSTISQVSIISLNSSNPAIIWKINPVDDIKAGGKQISDPDYALSKYVKGIVPGTVFTSYVEAGLEKDPNFGDNIYKVDESFYNRPFWYQADFETPKNISSGQRVWIHFDGTNRFADFYFNGIKLSGTANSTRDVSGHMIRTKYDITELLRFNGKNRVVVLITDADQKKERKSKESFGVASSPTYLAAAGWDWMPYVPGRLAGITGNVYLKITRDVIMEDPWIRSDLPTLQSAEISIKPNIKNLSNEQKTLVLSGSIQPGNIEFSKSISLSAGETSDINITKSDFSQLVISNPKLWWPNGYGEPNLYSCNLKIIVDGKISDEKTINFGIKKYSYEMVDNKVGYPVMTFFINDQKIYLKGGNWGMSEYLLRCRGEEYEKKILLHKDMNYNMIRLWTGCVTDDEFYDACDKHGIMVWDDFWLYVAYNDVADPDAFKSNALDKVKRLRNHPSIALWCGANETHPKPEFDNYLRDMIAKEDNNDRMYKSSSNQDGLSGSGWWGNQPPKHHFETSGSNLAWNDPPYPYGSDYGYGLRSEIGTATFPNYESVIKFIPKDQLWPLPTDNQLKEDDNTVWNRHFFGKEASNANPINYKKAINTQFGESSNLEEFCEKAQYLNIEVMKGMYEAWNDKMWNDASGILIWMSQSAYPSFVWQTYDYYYDATGSYWGAKKASEHVHIQWNSSNNSVKVINTTSKNIENVTAKATIFDFSGKEFTQYGKSSLLNVSSSDIAEAFKLNFNPSNLAHKKKTVASSSTKLMDASLINDGGAGSRWESEYTDPQWIYVDLGKKELIEKIILKWEAAHAKEYEIQISNNGKKWKTIHLETDCQGGTEQISFKPVKARFVKLNGKTRATNFGYSMFEFEVYGKKQATEELSPLHFIKLELTDSKGNLISDNFYWRNGIRDLDYTQLSQLPKADLSCSLIENDLEDDKKHIRVIIKNNSNSVSFGNRLRLVDKDTNERILPIFLSDNYFSLMPNEEKEITVKAETKLFEGKASLLLKQFGKEERKLLEF